MKARTAKERAVETATAQYIHPLTRDLVREVQKEARPHRFVRVPFNRRERGVWCTNCGGIIEYRPELLVNLIEDKEQTVTCPHCGAELKRTRFIRYGVGHKLFRDYSFILVAEVHGPWQVLRYFYVDYIAQIGREPEIHTPIEVGRRWYNIEHGGKPVVWSRSRMSGWYNCGFVLDSELSLKREDHPSIGYYGYGTVHYRIEEDAAVPSSRWHRLLRRDGFKGASTMRLLDLAAFDVPLVFGHPNLVTLYKAHQWALLKYYGAEASNGLDKIQEDWPSIKVALRHGYRITDPGLWHDYLVQLRELGEDVLSPHWICPVNLPLAHDLTNSRVQRLRKAKEVEKDKQRAAAAEEKYAKHIAPFLGLRLTGSGVVIAVIPSVEDVRQEGEHMHHCVFSMQYYNKQTSLLLSARDTDGHRLETIEFNLSSGKVEQSRAVQNGISHKHKQILAMMGAAADQITEAWKRSKAQKPEITIKPVQELVRAFV